MFTLLCLHCYVYNVDLKKAIAETESEIAKQQKEVNYWTKYKDMGQHDHATLVKALEQEVDDMTTSFNEMKGMTSLCCGRILGKVHILSICANIYVSNLSLSSDICPSYCIIQVPLW